MSLGHQTIRVNSHSIPHSLSSSESGELSTVIPCSKRLGLLVQRDRMDGEEANSHRNDDAD